MHHDCSLPICPAAVGDQQAEAKAEQAPPPSKKEPPIVAETKAQDGAAPNPPSGKKKNSAKKQKTEPGTADLMAQSSTSFLMYVSIHLSSNAFFVVFCFFFTFSRGSPCLGWLSSLCQPPGNTQWYRTSQRQWQETEKRNWQRYEWRTLYRKKKQSPFSHTLRRWIAGFFWTENSGLKLKELLSGLSTLTLTDAEAVGVMSLLQERSPSALEAWYKVRHYFECVGYLTDATSRRRLSF